MAENDPILEQRVEALEQFSQARVSEQVGELTERVSALESARTAEHPYLASKSDIVRLEALHAATQKQIAAQSEQFNKDLQAQSERFDAQIAAQSERFDAKLDAQSKQFNKDLQAQSERFDAQIAAQSERFDAKLDAQSKQFNTALKAQSEQLRKEWEQRINQLISWLIVTVITFGGLIIATAVFIVNRLPS